MIKTLAYKPTTYRRKKLFSSSSNQSLMSTKRFLSSMVSDTNLSVRRSTSFTSIGIASEETFFSAEDDDELDRLISQHYILRTAFDSDFSVPKTVFKKGGIVLDIGCGPGAWTMEMASQFPRTSFIGVDFREMTPRDIKPKNCHFQQLDIISSIKLPFGTNSVDYIFQRDMNWFLNAENWIPLVKEFYRILKPGGWIELVEPDLESQSSFENESYLNNKLLDLFTHKGKDVFVARKLSSIMAASSFRRISSHFQSIPLGWGNQKSCKTKQNKNNNNKEEDGSNSGSAFAKASASQQLWLLKSLQPSLSQITNITPDKYNSYLNELLIEWSEAHTYVNWHRSIAQKPS